jgi:uncharacterized OsmC-like protein
MQTIDINTLAAHSNALRIDQRALRKRYRVDAPEEALVTDTASSVAKAGESPMWGSVQIGAPDFGVAVPVGVHRAVGGRHDLPVPGDILCAALVACVDTTIRIISNNLGVPLESLEVDVQADCDVRGTLLVDSSVRVGFATMRVSVKAVPGPGISAKRVEELVQMAEQCCVVLQTVKNGVDVSLELDAGETAEATQGFRS